MTVITSAIIVLESLNSSLSVFVDYYSAIFKLDGTLCSRIIGSLFRAPRTICCYVSNIMRFAFGLNNPHGDRRILQMCLIKMKDSFLSFDIQNLRHIVSLS